MTPFQPSIGFDGRNLSDDGREYEDTCSKDLLSQGFVRCPRLVPRKETFGPLIRDLGSVPPMATDMASQSMIIIEIGLRGIKRGSGQRPSLTIDWNSRPGRTLVLEGCSGLSTA